MLNPEDPNVRLATMGRIVEDFIEGPIGSFLVERARIESEEAAEALKIVDASDTFQVRKLQHKALVADSIAGWLSQAIQEGYMALNALKEEING